VARFGRTLPAARLHNLYGPTETAVDVTAQACHGLPAGTIVPIGVPMPNVMVEILDPALRRVPVGVVGELFVGGVQLARGYLGAPGATAAAFVPDPFRSGGRRLYRTGDLAAWQTDGTVRFHGRRDGQVKINGIRVELSEIEARLTALPGVRNAAVAVRDVGGCHQLVAYVVAANTHEQDDWAGRLRHLLPGHMVPARFVPVRELPVNANGKLDRGALPEPSARSGPAAPGDPSDPTERAVAAIWRDLLDVPAVRADDDFFALGGDSIRGLKMLARLRRAGYDLTLDELFAAPALRDVVATLRAGTDRIRSEPVAVPAFGLLDTTDAARLRARKGVRP
jgi:aryl carrier-like protein